MTISETAGNTPETEKRFFAGSRVLLLVTVLVIAAVALAIRFYDLYDLPLDFHPTRQLHSAIMARGMYYEHLQTVDAWQREFAVEQWKAEGVIEPPIMERLTAFTYQLIGHEALWVARVYSILFWMIGGLGIFLLARELSGVNGAVVSLLYFLILPYGAIASRSFQPDPLMVTMIIFALWAAVRWLRTPTWRWTIAAGLLTGAAIFVKTVAVFFLGFGLIALVLFGMGLRKAIRDPKVWVLALLAVLPYGCYHVYGVYISGFLQSQFSLRFFPQMWSDPAFYLRWNNEMSRVVGFEWVLAAIPGIFLVRQRGPRALLAAAWLGYFIYGMTFAHHISTHDYYQLPFIPLVALGLGVLADTVMQNLRGPRALLTVMVLGVMLFGMAIKAWDVRVTLKRDDYRGEQQYWQDLGNTIGQGTSVIGLTHDYGYRLEYWGWVNPTNWMTSADFGLREMNGQQFDMDNVFKKAVRGKDFFVVTLFDELEHQPELKSLLYRNYPILKKGDGFVIFDLRNPLQPAPDAAAPADAAQPAAPAATPTPTP